MNEDYINVSVQHIKVPILKYIHLKKYIYIYYYCNIHTAIKYIIEDRRRIEMLLFVVALFNGWIIFFAQSKN